MTSYHVVGDGPLADVAAEAVFAVGGEVVREHDAEISILAGHPTRQAAAALRAVAAGRAAVLMGPIAARPADADRLLRVAAAGGQVSSGESLLFAPHVTTFRSALQGLGPLDHLGIRIHQAAPSWGGQGAVADGGGVSLDLGTRAVILAQYLMGDHRPVGVRGRFDHRDLDVDERADLQVRFDNDVVVGIEVAWTPGAAVLDAQAASPEASAFAQFHPEVVVEVDGQSLLPDGRSTGDGAEATNAADPMIDLGFTALVQEAAYARRTDSAIRLAPLRLAHTALDVVAGAAEAADTGHEVAIPVADRTRTPVERWRRA